MKTAEEMKEFRGTKGEWSINHWDKGECGVTCKGESNGITHYTGDNVYRKEYRIVSNLHPNSHNVEHSFEGAHIAEIAARSEESLANAQLIAAAPEMLKALQSIVEYWNTPQKGNLSLNDHVEHSLKLAEKAINKALGK
jgi:hypothetical protein